MIAVEVKSLMCKRILTVILYPFLQKFQNNINKKLLRNIFDMKNVFIVLFLVEIWIYLQILTKESKNFCVFQIIALEVQTKICVFFRNKLPSLIRI